MPSTGHSRRGLDFLIWLLEIPTRNWSAWMFSPGLVDGILDLFSRDWIDRIWCLQESLLARNLVLCCSRKSIAWSNFSYAPTYLKDRKKPYGVPLKRLNPMATAYIDAHPVPRQSKCGLGTAKVIPRWIPQGFLATTIRRAVHFTLYGLSHGVYSGLYRDCDDALYCS